MNTDEHGYVEGIRLGLFYLCLSVVRLKSR